MRTPPCTVPRSEAGRAMSCSTRASGPGHLAAAGGERPAPRARARRADARLSAAVSLSDRSILGVEALLRWEHPTRGRIAPGDFISVAEENGLIDPIGRWVLDRACRQAAHWYRTRPDAAPISMSVNLHRASGDRADPPGLRHRPGLSLLAPAAACRDHPDAAGRSRLAGPGRLSGRVRSGIGRVARLQGRDGCGGALGRPVGNRGFQRGGVVGGDHLQGVGGRAAGA
jgi:hypothetical protein